MIIPIPFFTSKGSTAKVSAENDRDIKVGKDRNKQFS
jgi:hypothetical protein